MRRKKINFGVLKIWRINRKENSKFSWNCNEEKRFVPNVCAELSLKNKTWMRITTLSSLQQTWCFYTCSLWLQSHDTCVVCVAIRACLPNTCKHPFSLNLAAG
jgi:hypothetical protein